MKKYELAIKCQLETKKLNYRTLNHSSITLHRREKVRVKLIAHHADSANRVRPSLTVVPLVLVDAFSLGTMVRLPKKDRRLNEI